MGESADAALLALRVVLGAVMLVHGWNHWRGVGGIAGTAGWFGGSDWCTRDCRRG